jgi:enoyl-CoA hydratase
VSFARREIRLSEYEFIKYEKQGHVAIVILNRPQAANAMSQKMTLEFEAAMHRAGDDPEVRVIVMTAEGKVFCAGGDVKEFIQATAEWIAKFNRVTFEVWRYMEHLRKPIIAAVQGFANIELIQGCDIVVAAEEASFALPEVKIGVCPGAGITIRLPRMVGKFVAKEILLMGERFSAQDAFRVGLVNRVVPKDKLMEEALRIASIIAKNGPLAVGAAKMCVNVGSEMDLGQGMEYQLLENVALFHSEDLKEGIRAFQEKREPQFQGK